MKKICGCSTLHLSQMADEKSKEKQTTEAQSTQNEQRTSQNNI